MILCYTFHQSSLDKMAIDITTVLVPASPRNITRLLPECGENWMTFSVRHTSKVILWTNENSAFTGSQCWMQITSILLSLKMALRK